jgi:hypothetical protein
MKSFRSLLFAGVAALLSVVPLGLFAANVTISPATETLYVKIDSPDLIWFRHYRLAETDGSELILDALKKTAADQVRFAKYPGAVTVLDDDARAPEGAAVLLLTWNNGAVSATLQRGGKEKEIGAVSRTPLSNHPDYVRMREKLDQGSSEERRDADLRARTQMNLYQSLRLVQRYQAKG